MQYHINITHRLCPFFILVTLFCFLSSLMALDVSSLQGISALFSLPPSLLKKVHVDTYAKSTHKRLYILVWFTCDNYPSIFGFYILLYSLYIITLYIIISMLSVNKYESVSILKTNKKELLNIQSINNRLGNYTDNEKYII